MEKTYIYTLSDPRSPDVIRYVGKSNNPETRLNFHLYDSFLKKHKTKRTCWLKSLRKLGLKPVLEVVDVVSLSEWQFWECYYISLFRSWGFKLVNMTDGGEGLNNPSEEVVNTIKKKCKENACKYWLGKKRPPFSEEWRRKLGEKSTGRKFPNRKVPEKTKKHFSEIFKGEGNPNYNNRWSEEQKQRMRDRLKNKWDEIYLERNSMIF